MSEGPEAASKPKGGFLSWALWGVALVGVAAVLYIIVQASSKPKPPPPAASAFAAKVDRKNQASPPPDYAFYDAAGKPVKIADLKGKVVVMNIWATWCAPCVTEMPTLAKLQAAYADKPVEVVTVSIDSESSAAKARLFIAQHDPLKFYHDREMKLPFKLTPPAPGAPTTVIYGKDGLEVARVAGEADWAGPEARKLVDEALAGG
ncbi:MAG: TlpA family protein disulfide reductase [Pseudomonadota bacterium]|jgi:thiol-disulfide isomerase/thioredoxin